MKGIVLAGGSGTRLHPITLASSKQLLPIYNKPMIYYSLSTLMLAGIREILIISTPHDLPRFESMLGDGTRLGMTLRYAVQEVPNGLARAFVIGEEFIAGEPVGLVLGDNLFYGHSLTSVLERAASQTSGATIFGYYVRDPERYGVIEFDDAMRPVDLVEKPVKAPSHYAVPGLYFYDEQVVGIAQRLAPSPRGEYEITDLNREYLRAGTMRVELLSRGIAWLDTGTPTSLLEASNFVAAVEQRQDLMIGSIEEIAFRKGFIDRQQLEAAAVPLGKSDYGQYLLRIAREARP